MKRIKKKLPKPVIHDQWIEVTLENGKTVSTYYPPNAEFEKLRQERDSQPQLIYRRFNFVHGVPAEYAWTAPPTPEAGRYGGHALQRMSVEDWLRVMEKESSFGTGHALSCSNPLPRPAAFGPCPCPRCTKRREQEEAA